jgi:hypothetical protein
LGYHSMYLRVLKVLIGTDIIKYLEVC